MYLASGTDEAFVKEEAALLGVAQVSDVMSVEGSHVFKRPIYAGNAIITVEADATKPVVATIDGEHALSMGEHRSGSAHGDAEVVEEL